MPWPDTVGVQHGRQPGAVGAQFVSTNGDASVNSPVWQLPPGDRPLALAGNGLLIEDRSGQIRTWSLTDGRLGPVLGRTASVIDIHGDEVAWRAAAGCRDGECPLHLTDASTGADRVVTPLPAHAGFLDGGSFSSDGAAVAAFISAPTQGGPGGQLVLIDTTAATVTNTVAGSVVPLAQGRSMAAAWPPDSAVVFFCGPAARCTPTGPTTERPSPSTLRRRTISSSGERPAPTPVLRSRPDWTPEGGRPSSPRPGVRRRIGS